MIQGTGGGTVVIQAPEIPQIPPVPDFPTPAPWEVMPPQVLAIIALAFIAASALVLWPLFRAIARRIEGRGTADAGHLREELMDLRERVQLLEGAQARVLELEERLDFAERLLTDRGAPARLREPEAR
jgi:hypothetical protein